MDEIVAELKACLESIDEITAELKELLDAVIGRLSRDKLSFDEDNLFETFGLICKLIGTTVESSIGETGISTVTKKLNLSFDILTKIFENFFDKNQHCHECFLLYERMCKTLVQPIERVEAAGVRGDIDDCTSQLHKMIRRSGYEVPMKAFLYSANSLFSSLLTYWTDTHALESQYGIGGVKNVFLVSAIKLFSLCSCTFDKYEPSSCQCDTGSCLLTKDIHSAVTLRVKCIAVSAAATVDEDMWEKLCNVILETAVEAVSGIAFMKENWCKRWTYLWERCKDAMYNMRYRCERYHVELRFFDFLLQNILRLERPPLAEFVGSDISMFDVLDGLTSIHRESGRYNRASIFCSLNGLLSYEISNSRIVYEDWADIKQQQADLREVTMLQCLRSNGDEIAKFLRVDLDDYDLIAVCLREIMGLREASVDLSSSIVAVIDEMERLNASPVRYALGVQQLGYHLLQFKHERSIATYVKKAILKMLESDISPNASFLLCYGNLHLYLFIERISDIRSKTSFAIDRDGNPLPVTETNLTLTTELEALLMPALERWERALDYGLKGMLTECETSQARECVMIAGEYARIYNFENLENRIWNLAYRMAEELDDHETIIYAISRMLSRLEIDPRLIERTDESLVTLARTGFQNKTVARYWLSLANFYFAGDKTLQAEECMERAAAEIDPRSWIDPTNHLLRNDIVATHMWNEEQLDGRPTTYFRIIADIILATTLLDIDTTKTVRSRYVKDRLYEYDALFEQTINLAIHGDGSFEKISELLNLRLKTSQEMGAALKVAECLKSLCQVNLLCTSLYKQPDLDYCEARLKELEQILDIGRPVPEFVLHGDDCACFKCTNKRYRYLVFACVHLRAKLFSLQEKSDEAAERFEGALEIWKINRSKDSTKSIHTARKIGTILLLRQRETLEYIMLLLDYCEFLEPSKPSRMTDIMNLSQEALDLCYVNLPKEHPIYVSVDKFHQKHHGRNRRQ